MPMQLICGCGTRWPWLAMVAPAVGSAAAEGDLPVIPWSSDPVQPDETLPRIGHAFAADATIAVARRKDEPASAAGTPGKSSLKAVMAAVGRWWWTARDRCRGHCWRIPINLRKTT